MRVGPPSFSRSSRSPRRACSMPKHRWAVAIKSPEAEWRRPAAVCGRSRSNFSRETAVQSFFEWVVSPSVVRRTIDRIRKTLSVGGCARADIRVPCGRHRHHLGPTPRGRKPRSPGKRARRGRRGCRVAGADRLPTLRRIHARRESLGRPSRRKHGACRPKRQCRALWRAGTRRHPLANRGNAACRTPFARYGESHVDRQHVHADARRRGRASRVRRTNRGVARAALFAMCRGRPVHACGLHRIDDGNSAGISLGERTRAASRTAFAAP